MKQIKLGDLITEEEIGSLRKFVAECRKGKLLPSPHNCIMTWIERNPQVRDRFKTHGVLKAYGAYLFEYYLQIK